MEIRARRSGEKEYSVLNDDGTLASEKDRYFMVVRALSPGYLYVFQVDSLGTRSWFHPRNDACSFSSGENPLKEGDTIQMPTAESGQAIYLDKTIGIEHMYAVFSLSRWPELEKALAVPDRPRAEPAPSKAVARLDEPRLLGTRGAGGATKDSLLAAQNKPVIFERVDEGKAYSVQFAAKPVRGSGTFIVLERYFKHVDAH